VRWSFHNVSSSAFSGGKRLFPSVGIAMWGIIVIPSPYNPTIRRSPRTHTVRIISLRHMCANVRIIIVGRIAWICSSRPSFPRYARVAATPRRYWPRSTAPSCCYRCRFRELVLLARDISHAVKREAAPRRGIGGLRLHPWRVASARPGATRTLLGAQASRRHDAEILSSLSLIWFSNNALYAGEREMHLQR